jgi:hypothetical protein
MNQLPFSPTVTPEEAGLQAITKGNSIQTSNKTERIFKKVTFITMLLSK